MSIRYLISLSLLMLMLMIGAYDFAVRYFIPKNPATTESQWSLNTVWAQRYIYDRKEDSRVVIVGSSLAQRIVNAWLPPGFINIAMTAQSSLDGLAIITRSGGRPDLVLIETNVLHVPEKTAFLDGLFNPVLQDARGLLPSLREENRPIGEVKGALTTALKEHFASAPVEKTAASPRASTTSHKLAEVREKALQKHQREYAKTLPPALLAERLQRVAAYIQTLEERGARIAFFEVPSHPSLCASARMRAIRAEVIKTFPKYPYLRDRNCQRYHVSDGLHLDMPSAHAFGERLYQVLRKQHLLPAAVLARRD